MPQHGQNQIVTVREPLRTTPAAPEPLKILAATQLNEVNEVRERLARILYEAEIEATLKGFPAGVVFAIRADRRNTVEALHLMAAHEDAEGRPDRASAFRDVAKLIKPVGDK